LALFFSFTVSLLLTSLSFGLLLLVMAISVLSVVQRRAQTRYTHSRIDQGFLPKVDQLGRLAASRLALPLQDLFYELNAAPNAYASGFRGRCWVVLSSRLIDLLTPQELLFVIGHEMGHVRRHHTTWLLFTAQQQAFNAPIFGMLFRLIFGQWSLRIEYSADRDGLIACGDLRTAISALVKVHFGEKSGDLAQRAAEAESAKVDPVAAISEQFGTHPFLQNRVRNLKQFNEVLIRRAA
jgi:Zn-dependent protease with chaperone function